MSASNMHEYAREMKERLVASKGIQDLAPFVVVLTDEGRTYLGKPGRMMDKALEAGMRMGTILAGSIEALRRDNDMVGVRRMMMVVEGYSRTMPLDERAGRPPVEHGDLAKDFTTNADTDVVEVLMTNIWEWDGDEVQYQLWISPFHYVDGGEIVWGETVGPLGTAGDMAGAIYDAGKAVMR